MADRTTFPQRFRPHARGPRLVPLVTGSALIAAGIAGVLIDTGTAERAAALTAGAAIGAITGFLGILWRLRRMLRDQ